MASVDIVIPCYNYAHFLPQCVQSVLVQGVEDVRIVIIDNASTDNSVEVARQLAETDGRIEVICHQVNLGSHASFNQGIDLARADYFMILCADDLLTPGALRHGMALLDRFPEVSVVLGGRMAPWVGNGTPVLPAHDDGWSLTVGDRLIEMCCRKMKFDLPAHAMLVRTSVQKAVGHYRPSIPLLDDLEMALRLARQGSVAELSAPLAITREHTTNISQVMWQDALRRLQEYETVWESFFGHEGSTMPNSPTLHRMIRRHLASAAYWSAVSHLMRGKRTAGFELFKFGRRLDPAFMLLPPIGHLFLKEGSFKRARSVILEVLGGTRPRNLYLEKKMSGLSMDSSTNKQYPDPQLAGKAAVVLVTDKNYFLPTFATALSADAHTGHEIVIHLFVVDAEETWLRQFDKAVSGTKISVRTANLPQLAELSRSHRDVVPPIALARLWIGSLLDEDIGRFLYIDGDIMVDNELDSLLAMAPPEDGLMAVPEFIRIYIDELSFSKRKDFDHLRNLECSPSSYFNSGVIYTSRKAWNSFSSVAIKFIREYPDRCYASDQSALNHAARGRVNFLPLHYNYQSDYMMALDPRERGLKPTIWHFVGAPKPWNATGWPWDEYFNKFYRQAELLLRDCNVTLPVPPEAQIVSGLSHRGRNRFRMKWVYPWRRYTRRRKILSMLQ